MVPPRGAGHLSRLRRAARLVLGGLLAVGFLALALREVDAEQLRQVMLRADAGLLVAVLAVASANLLLRASRWWVLLSAGGAVPFRLAFWVMNVGYLGNSSLPMRAGDFGRCYLIGQRAAISGTFALATTLVERVMDAAFLVVVGGLSLLGHPLVPEWMTQGLLVLAVASGGALCVLLALPWLWQPLASILEGIPKLAPPFWRLRERWLDKFIDGLASIRHPGRMLAFLGLTCAIWLADAVGTTLVARALGAQLSLPAALVVLSALGASSAVSLTPGQIGVFQWVASSVLGSYGIPPEPALLIAIGLQAANYLVLLAFGTVGVFQLGPLEILKMFADPSKTIAPPSSEAVTETGPKHELVSVPTKARLRISIVTPSYNQAGFLPETIESVLAQEGNFDLEYLVVDGGSSDGSLSILKEYRGRLMWVSEPDRGQVDAINKGLARCTGEVVGWLNSDDLLLPGALERVAQAFQSRSGINWVHGRCWIIDERGKRIRRWVEAYKHYRAKQHSFERLLLENYVNQMTVFWRRELLQSIGYLDPAYPLAFDYELWLRFARRSPPTYIEQPQACFRWYEASKSGTGFKAQFAENAVAAEAHSTGRSHLLRPRRSLSRLFVLTYKLMASGRRLARALRPR